MRFLRVATLALLMGPWASAAKFEAAPEADGERLEQAPGRSAREFAAPPPRLIAGFAGFERIGGELISPRLKAGYLFYVDPARAALFTVMRYRLRQSGPVESPTEKFVWNERPGEPVPLRCFEWVEAGGGGAWREMLSDGADYHREMVTLLLVLAEQNRAYRQQIGQ